MILLASSSVRIGSATGFVASGQPVAVARTRLARTHRQIRKSPGVWLDRYDRLR
jgi:hypothetical protein